MNTIPVLAWIFQGIPESIAIIFTSVSFLGVNGKEKFRLIILFGFIEACCVYLSRTLPVSFGVHMSFSVLTIMIWSYFITKKPIINCILSSFIVLALIILFEIISFYLITYLFSISKEDIINNMGLRILIGWPQILFLMICGYGYSKLSSSLKTNN